MQLAIFAALPMASLALLGLDYGLQVQNMMVAGISLMVGLLAGATLLVVLRFER